MACGEMLFELEDTHTRHHVHLHFICGLYQHTHTTNIHQHVICGSYQHTQLRACVCIMCTKPKCVYNVQATKMCVCIMCRKPKCVCIMCRKPTPAAWHARRKPQNMRTITRTRTRTHTHTPIPQKRGTHMRTTMATHTSMRGLRMGRRGMCTQVRLGLI